MSIVAHGVVLLPLLLTHHPPPRVRVSPKQPRPSDGFSPPTPYGHISERRYDLYLYLYIGAPSGIFTQKLGLGGVRLGLEVNPLTTVPRSGGVPGSALMWRATLASTTGEPLVAINRPSAVSRSVRAVASPWPHATRSSSSSASLSSRRDRSLRSSVDRCFSSASSRGRAEFFESSGPRMCTRWRAHT